jgi:hypothetical protein
VEESGIGAICGTNPHLPDELRRRTKTLCQDSREVTGLRFEARTFRIRSRKDANWTVTFSGKACGAEPGKCHFT